MKKLIFILALTLLFAACSVEENAPTDFNVLNNLPVDTGGVQSVYNHQSTNAPYGFYAYTPSSYNVDGPNYPLLVYLHGSEEIGDSAIDPTQLSKLMQSGPPMLIGQNNWDPTYPMVVVSPQSHETNWETDKIHDLISYLIDHFKVNEKRIYLIGCGIGGDAVFRYAREYSNDSYAAACVPIFEDEKIIKAKNFSKIPTWMLRGSAEGGVAVNTSIKTKENISVLSPMQKVKISTYYVGDDYSWPISNVDTDMGIEDNDIMAFSQSIYDWMFQFEKD